MNNIDPEVSVVMSVYNGADHLSDSIDSVLSQLDVDLEFVIVNDGSTDRTAAVLEDYASRDSRVRVITQENQGLTCALIRGCSEARGEYIARQDAGDLSLPNRLAIQLAAYRRAPHATFVSCGTRYVGPLGEFLYEVHRQPKDARSSLMSLDLRTVEGPSSHPCNMFSKSLYDRVGGYRACFYFAQDLDLWIRFAELGDPVVLSQVLYEARFAVAAISGVHRREQVATAKLILESARVRREDASDLEILERASRIKPGRAAAFQLLKRRAAALYFIGTCLKKRGDPSANKYFRLALHTYPLHLKAMAQLLVL
jgi:glycosyltransferase involved in cell wall biosynthesis